MTNWRTMAAGLFVVGLMMGALGGCDGARVEVASEQVTDRIDSMLGEMEVRRKEIEHSTRSLREGLNGLRKAQIEASVRRDQIGRRAEPVSRRIKDIDAALQSLRDRLEAKEPVTLGNHTYSPVELRDLASRLIAERKRCEEELEGFQVAQNRLGDVVTTLERRRSDYERRLNEIEGQLDVIDSKRLALTAMRQAAATMEGTDPTLSGKVAELEESVSGLYAGMEAELAAEGADWDGNKYEQDLDAVDALIAADQGPADLVAEIDAVLAGPDNPTISEVAAE